MGAHAIAAQPAGVGQFQRTCQPTVIGEQQQALGVEVEPADRDQPRQAFGQIVEHGRPPFGIGMRRHQPARLVIEEQPRTLARRQFLAVDRNDVVRGDIQRRRIDDAAVHGDAALRHHLLGIATRSEPGAGEYLGDALAGLLRLRCLAWRTPVEVRLPLAIGAAAAEGGTFRENLAVVLIVAARAVGETVGRTALAARMLLPVHAAFRPLAAGAIELAFSPFFAVTLPARTVEFRAVGAIKPRPIPERPVALHPILARTRKSRALVTPTIIARTVETRLVETRPCATFFASASLALLPRLGLAARRPIAEILARPVAARPVTEFAVGETSLAPLTAWRAHLESRTVATIKLRTVAARLEVPLLSALTVKPRGARPIAKLALRETPFRATFAALTSRRTIAIEFRAVAAIELRTISARLEVPFLASSAVVTSS